MKELIAKLKTPKTKAAFKSYVRAVLASAITMGIALEIGRASCRERV